MPVTGIDDGLMPSDDKLPEGGEEFPLHPEGKPLEPDFRTPLKPRNVIIIVISKLIKFNQ